MFRRDRRELAVLGLVVLAWGLFVAPMAHRDDHSHGVAHSHGPQKQVPPDGDSHGAGSVEHQALAFTTGAVLPAPAIVFVALSWSHDVVPEVPHVSASRRVEQSQAP